MFEQPSNNSGVQLLTNTTTNATLTTLSSPNNQHSMVLSTNKTCLLKTAVATVSSSHAEVKTNIVFDEGSQ